ncbi:MAG: hypothetical protein U9N82_02965 [Thermodesulfobacteriota bacterium]|nr:hypothetical protein [Thermodesulfobacteriota bacterium]
MDYIICHHKRSMPRVSVDVCKKCGRMNRCADYADYVQPLLFPGLIRATHTRTVKRKRSNPEDTKVSGMPEQLALYQ